jgi:hypothetical protein
MLARPRVWVKVDTMVVSNDVTTVVDTSRVVVDSMLVMVTVSVLR